MRSQGGDALVEALRASYEQKRQDLQPLLDAEAKIRAALARLDRQNRAVQSEAANFDRFRSFGGDVLWASWLGRQRRDLNIRLARVLVEKDEQFEQLKGLYAKVLAAETMRDAARDEAMCARARREEADRLDLILRASPAR